MNRIYRFVFLVVLLVVMMFLILFAPLLVYPYTYSGTMETYHRLGGLVWELHLYGPFEGMFSLDYILLNYYWDLFYSHLFLMIMVILYYARLIPRKFVFVASLVPTIILLRYVNLNPEYLAFPIPIMLVFVLILVLAIKCPN